MFTIVRVYSDECGDSHFEEMQIPLIHSGQVGALSQPIEVEKLIFREVEPTYDWDFHCAPEKQFIILLDGEIEIETSLGEKRKFTSGQILRVEDTTGKGHRTRNLQANKRRSVFITFR